MKPAVNIDQALSPAEQYIQQLKSLKNKDAQSLAQSLTQKVQEFRDAHNGVPGTPATPAQTVTEKVPFGMGQMSQERVIPANPGVAEIPADPLSGADLQKEKQFITAQMPGNAYMPTTKTPAELKFDKTLAGGMREEIENHVGQAINPQTQTALQDLNDSAGQMLSTKRGQLAVEAQRARDMNNLANPVGGTKGMIAGMGEALDPTGHASVRGVIAKTIADALKTGAMPAGYGLRTMGDARLSPLIDMAVKQKLLNEANNKQGVGP